MAPAELHGPTGLSIPFAGCKEQAVVSLVALSEFAFRQFFNF